MLLLLLWLWLVLCLNASCLTLSLSTLFSFVQNLKPIRLSRKNKITFLNIFFCFYTIFKIQDRIISPMSKSGVIPFHRQQKNGFSAFIRPTLYFLWAYLNNSLCTISSLISALKKTPREREKYIIRPISLKITLFLNLLYFYLKSMKEKFECFK